MRGWMMSRQSVVARQHARRAAADRGDLQRLVLGRPSPASAQPERILIFSASCGGVRRPKAMSLVSWWPPIGMTLVCATAPVGEDGDVGGAAADVDQRDAQPLLVLLQHRLARGERLEHDVQHLEVAAGAALDDVLRGGGRGGHDVDARLEAHAAHAERLAHAVLAVDLVLLRQHVDDVAVDRQRDGARQLQHLVHVGGADLLVLDRHRARRVDALDVAARDADVDLRDLAAGHALGFEDRLLDRGHRRVDVDDDALLEAARRVGADADDVEAVWADLADDAAILVVPMSRPTMMSEASSRHVRPSCFLLALALRPAPRVGPGLPSAAPSR